jgi:hypothetical protein
MNLRQRLLLTGVLAVTQGCYQYHALPSDLRGATDDVRISLTDRGSVELGPLIGPQITKIEGDLTEAADTMYVVRMSRVINRAGYSTPWSGETLRVPRSMTASIERKELNRSRSWLLGGGSLAAVALVAMTVQLTGNTSGSAKLPPGGSK